jgi:hypothetical protein
MQSVNCDLIVYITHFTPPKKKKTDWFKYFISSRANVNYFRSWARLLKHGTRGNQPWKKDAMTDVRSRDYKNRYVYLSEVLSELNKLDVNKIIINIFTNSREVKTELIKRNMTKNVKYFFYENYSKINVLHNSPWILNDLKSPWLLTWEHKKIMLEDIKNGNENSLFLYIENDMKFTQSNLDYWLQSRECLKSTSLIPSFVRVEYSHRQKCLVAIDHFGGKASKISELPQFKNHEKIFVQLVNPYCATNLMDLKIAEEYANSKAFSEIESRDLTWWDIGARTSMGVQFLDVPYNFTSRHVVPVEKSGKHYKVLDSAILHHLPNLYCQVAEIEKGFLPVDLLISE